MRTFYLWSIILLLPSILHAQTTTSNLDSTRILYSKLFDYDVPGQALADLNFTSLMFENHTGHPEDSLGSPDAVRQTIHTLKSMVEDQNSIPSLWQFDSIVGQYRDQGYHPISIIDYDYARLDSGFYFWDELSFDEANYRLEFDQDPSQYFEKKRVLLFTGFDPILNQDKVRFILPYELFISNRNSADSIFMDFGDGNGLRQVICGEPITIDYTGVLDGLEQGVNVALFLKLGEQVLNRAESTLPAFTIPDPDYTTSSLNIIVRNPCEKFERKDLGPARIYIRYGKSQSASKEIRKPFILIEGFDIDNNPNDGRFGDVGWSTVISGLSFNTNNEPVRKNLADLKDLTERLYQDNYDLIFIDFQDGSGDLFKNGNSVINIIQWINQEKTSDEELIVMGASMGGLIARYALRKMELQDCNHCTKLYGTFDSPHQGANIPLGLQHATYFFKDFSASSLTAYNGLGSAAAMQMLIYNIYPGAKSKRAEWQAWLDANGHPQIPRRICLTNGHPHGVGDFTDYALLYKKCIRVGSSPNFECVIYAANPGGTVFRGKYPTGLGGWLGWFNALVGTGVETEVFAPDNHTYYDHAAGGTSDWIRTLDQGISASLDPPSLKNRCGGTIIKNNGSSCFVPTYSALDYYFPDRFLNVRDEFPGTVSRTVESFKHPFHSFYNHSPTSSSVPGNQVHVFVDSDPGQNVDWLMEELHKSDPQIDDQLPTASGQNRFNYSEIGYYRKIVPNIEINNGGQLYLNRYARKNYGTLNDPWPSPKGSTQNFYSSSCGSYIKVNSEGVLELGDASQPASAAVFYLGKGSVIDLRQGGMLRIHNGSKLVIEEGAKLIYAKGAQIELLGSNSKIEVHGKIQVEANAVFEIRKGAASETGYLHTYINQYNEGKIFDLLGSGVKLLLNGSRNFGETLLRIDGGSLVFQAQFESVGINKGSVLYGDGSSLEVHSKIETEYVLYKADIDASLTSSLVLMYAGSDLIQNNRFENLTTGIELRKSPGLTQAIKWCQFKSCGTGIYVEEGKSSINANNFINCSSSGVLLNTTENQQLISNKFIGLSKGITIINKGFTVKQHYLENNFFEGLDEAIYTEDFNSLTLKCNIFQYNQLAIRSFGILNLSTSLLLNGKQGGSNSFYANKQCIKGNTELYLEAGMNNFFKAISNNLPFIDVQVNPSCPCLSPSNHLLAGDNFWYPKPSGGSITGAGAFYYALTVWSFPHPIYSELEGSMLLNYNDECFLLNPDFINELELIPGAVSGIDELGLTDEVEVYPNPIGNRINLKVSGELNQTIEVELVSASGTVLRQEVVSLDHGLVTIEIGPELKPGLYFLRITGSGFSSVKKLIKE